MAVAGYNEADTRAKLIDPSLHALRWIELVKDEQRTTHGEIHREQSAVRIDILDGKPIKRGRGRVDYLLRAYIEAHEHLLTLAFVEAKREKLLPTQGLEQVKEYARRHTVKFVYPIALANLMLHGIDEPRLWHGNTLSKQTVYGGLWEDAPERFHVVLTNPPFGGKEGKEAQGPFPFKTRVTQALFVQYVMRILEPGGRCGIVLDEGLLYRTTEESFVKTKRKLLDEFDVWCIVSLPGGAFTGSGAGVKTNLVFFTNGRKTERIWYYDISHIKVGKKTPLTMQRFAPFFEFLDKRGTPEAETEHSWTVDFAERKRRAAEEAAPHGREAETQREKMLELRERTKVLRKAGDTKNADALLPEIEGADKAQRDALNRAIAIDDAVYDLKAVNPREKKVLDTRTPAQLLDAIAEKGREVDAALKNLRALL